MIILLKFSAISYFLNYLALVLRIQPSEHIDIMPTILELLNINLSDSDSSIDGKSILSDLIDNQKKSLFLVF